MLSVRRKLPIALFMSLISVVPSGKASEMSKININFVPNSAVTITPLANASPSIFSARPGGEKLAWPPGSFALKNLSSQPITAVIMEWRSVDAVGQQSIRELNLDGYLISNGIIIPAGETAVVTPKGSIRLEYVPYLAGGGSLLGGDSPLLSPDEARDQGSFSPATITIVIDSIIFANGEIVGPNTKHYETTIQDRYEAAQTVINGLTAARASGIDDHIYLDQLDKETDRNINTFNRWKGRFAATLHRSPNIDGTLNDMKEMRVPTKFFNTSISNGDPR